MGPSDPAREHDERDDVGKRLEELRGNVEHAQALELISIDEDGL